MQHLGELSIEVNENIFLVKTEHKVQMHISEESI